MNKLFSNLDFTNIPFPQDYESFVTKEAEGKLFCPDEALVARGGQGLGDVIGCINFAYHVSDYLSRPVGLCWKAWNREAGKFKQKAEEIIPALGPEFEKRVYVSDKVWQNWDWGKAMWPWHYAVPYFPSSRAWKDNDSHVVAYQLDGKSKGGQKNLPPDQKDMLLKYMSGLGFKMVPLKFKDDEGEYMPITSWIDILTSAELFMGVCSGGLHLAHCVGTPRIAFVNDYEHSLLDPQKSSHRNKAFVYFKDFYALEDAL